MMSDYIKKSEADLLNEKERKIKKQKEDKEYLKWKKEKEANKTKMSHYLIIQQCQN